MNNQSESIDWSKDEEVVRAAVPDVDHATVVHCSFSHAKAYMGNPPDFVVWKELRREEPTHSFEQAHNPKYAPSPVEEAKCECGHALENHADENGGYSWACESCPQKAPCIKFRKASRLQPSPTEEARSGADRRAGIIADEIAGRLQSSSVESNHFEEAVDEVIRLSRQNNPEAGVSEAKPEPEWCRCVDGGVHPIGTVEDCPYCTRKRELTAASVQPVAASPEGDLLHEANEWLAGFDGQVWEPNLAKGVQLVSMLMVALTPQEGAKPQDMEHSQSAAAGAIPASSQEGVGEGKSSDSREDGFEEWRSAQDGDIVVEMGDDEGLQNALLALAKIAWQAALRSQPKLIADAEQRGKEEGLRLAAKTCLDKRSNLNTDWHKGYEQAVRHCYEDISALIPAAQPEKGSK